MATDTRQRLLDAAIELLIDEGAAALTTTRLTARAGVVQSGFYGHFDSIVDCKAEAVAEVERQVLAISGDIAKQTSTFRSDSAVEGARLLERFFDKALQRPSLFRLMLVGDRDPAVSGMIEGLLAGITSDLQDGLQRPGSSVEHAPDDEIDMMSDLIMGMILTSLDQVLSGADPVAVARTTGEMISGGVHGVADRLSRTN